MYGCEWEKLTKLDANKEIHKDQNNKICYREVYGSKQTKRSQKWLSDKIALIIGWMVPNG